MSQKISKNNRTKAENPGALEKKKTKDTSIPGDLTGLAGNLIMGGDLQALNQKDILAVQRRYGNQAAISIGSRAADPGIQRLVSSTDFTKSTRLSFGRKGKSGEFFTTVASELKAYEKLTSDKADNSTKKTKLHAILKLLGGWIDTEAATSSRSKAVLSLQSELKTELSKNTAVTSDAVILTSDSTLAKEANIGPYSGMVRTILKGWGLPFGSNLVLFENLSLGKQVKPSIILVWDSAWGDKPQTKEMPPNLSPIDANAALKAVHGLPGWEKLGKTDQGRLDAMLGGETSVLSQNARDYLKGGFTEVKGLDQRSQKKVLSSIITSENAIPSVVDEKVTSPKAEYSMDPAVVIKDYAFHGKKADAEKTVVKFKDGANVPILAPKAPTPGFHNHTVVQTADAAAYLPKAVRKLITEVVLGPVTNPDDPYWATQYKTPDFHSYMTSGIAGVVTIYPDKTAKKLANENYQRGTLLHETGHTWSYKNWGQDTTKGKWLKWKEAMQKDKIAPSKYATNSIDEDIAESIQVYASTKGSPTFDEYKRMMPSRFKILAAEYDK